MRGGKKFRGGKGGNGSARFLSSNAPDHRSDRRSNPFPHRPRRSLSPPMQGRPRRSPGRRSSSIERRNFAPRGTNRGKQPLGDHHSRNRGPFEDKDYEFQHKYMLPENSADPISDVNPISKLSRVDKDIDFHHQGSGGGLGGEGILLRSSMFLEDGPARTFFTLPSDSTGYLSGSAALKPESTGSGLGNLNAGIYSNDMPHYRERPRDPTDGKDMEKVYPRDGAFPMIPSSQMRPCENASSSHLIKDDLFGLYRDQVYRDQASQPSDGYGRVGGSSFLDDPLDRAGYSPLKLSDPVRRNPLGPLARDSPRDYGYLDDRRAKSDREFLTDYTKMPMGYQGHFSETLGSSFMSFDGDRVARSDLSRKKLTESSLWDHRRPVHGDADLNRYDVNIVHEDYAGGSGSGRDEFRLKSSRDHELAPIEERYALRRDPAPMAYRERPRSPMMPDHDMDIQRQNVSHLPRGTSRMVDYGVYDLPPERTIRRSYATDNDVIETDSRRKFSNDRSVFRRIQSPSEHDKTWSTEDRVEFLHSKKLNFEHPHRRMSAHRASRHNAWLQSADSAAHAEGGHDMSLKRRLWSRNSESHGSFYSEKNYEFRPRKFGRRDFEDRRGDLNAHERDVLDGDGARLTKTDPPEDSEEFKQQVHKAFLRFSKLLNESPHQRRRYRDEGKSGNLLCCVCGSHSKEFMDTHTLVMHTYNSLKVGFRTEHLGLHKALCVLMGWNWGLAPQNSKAYHSTPVDEAKSLKEDLILWPPLVIIHNSSIGNKKNSDGSKIIPIENIEVILRDMGFEAGKICVCGGRPANQSVVLVKFKPTFSGLREAERLHDLYAGNGHGRLEFQQIASKKTGGGKVDEAKVEELLYGYMAVAEDMDKLDPETKKRSLVKSKKDIEAIADAPLNAD